MGIKYVHSMWSSPATKKEFDNNFDVKYLNENFYSYLLSALLVKRMGKRIELYCDEKTAEMYSIIPYDKINVIDFDSDGVDSKFWIWGKIKTHTLMDEPYVHIDGDVFLFRDIIGNKMNTYKAVVQSVENYNTMGDNFTKLYTNSKNPFIDLNVGIDWSRYSLTAYNCGVVGFSDMNLRNEYANKVKEILVKISSNKNFEDNRKKYEGMFLIAEQSLLFYILNENDVMPLEIIPYREMAKRNFNWYSIAPEIGYCHMWGYTKYKSDVIKKIKYKLLNYFPEYKRVLEKFENKLNLV